MNNLIVLHSYHHGSTKKVAAAMSDILEAEIKPAAGTGADEPGKYELVGFGAGIDSGRHYKELLDYACRLPAGDKKPCFIFSTSGVYTVKKMAADHAALREILLAKGYVVVGEFSCRGYNTNSFLKHFGGMNKGCPTEEDLKNARAFAERMKQL